MLPKAREGDRDAQYHLFRALDYCRRGYREYFDRGQKRNSLDEAVREAAAAPRADVSELRRVHSRCEKLMAYPGDGGLAAAAEPQVSMLEEESRPMLFGGDRIVVPEPKHLEAGHVR